MSSVDADKVWASRILMAPSSFPHFLYCVAIEDVRGLTCRLPWLKENDPMQRGAMRFERWDYLVERAVAWQSGKSEIVLKARQLGFTWLAAAYALWLALRPGTRILVISKGQLEAFAFISRVRFIYERLPDALKLPLVTDNEGELKFQGGGTIMGLPSTRHAGRGFTGALLLFDENAFHVWAAMNWKGARGAVADVGQTIVMSTANGSVGHFHDMFVGATELQGRLPEMRRAAEVAEDAGRFEEAAEIRRASAALEAAALTPIFIPALARPGRSAEWLEAERAIYQGVPGEFTAEYPMNIDEAFVKLTGLVYPMFTPEKHISDWSPVKWEDCAYRVVAYDLGGGDPTAFVFLGAYRRPGDVWRIHQYGEWHAPRDAGAISAEQANEILTQDKWMHGARLTSVQCDPKEPSLAATLKSLYGYPVEIANWKRGEGLGIVSRWLTDGTLTFHKRCEFTIGEFPSYRWQYHMDPNSREHYATNTPVDNHGDHMDALRYGMIYMHYLLLNENGGQASESRTVLW